MQSKRLCVFRGCSPLMAGAADSIGRACRALAQALALVWHELTAVRRGMAMLLSVLLFLPQLDMLAEQQPDAPPDQQGQPRFRLPAPFVEHYRFPCSVEAAASAVPQLLCDSTEERRREVGCRPDDPEDDLLG